MTTTANILVQREQEKKQFVNDMYLTAGVSYWGDIIKNFTPEQTERDYDTIPQSYTIIDMDYESIKRQESKSTFTPEELFDKFYEYANALLKRNYETATVNRYFVEWAKNVVALDLDTAACSADADIADCAVQFAIFGKQKYA